MPQVARTVNVAADRHAVYELWSDFERFPRFMKYVDEIRRNPDGTTHWVAKGPMGMTAEWDARITADEEDKRIAWETVGGRANVAGEVRFEPTGDEHARVTVRLRFEPRGRLSRLATGGLWRMVGHELAEDLRRFRDYAERHRPDD